MKVVRLEIEHYRGIRRLNLDFGTSNVVVLAGVNGAGKSAVLDCTAVLLSRFVRRILPTKGTGRMFSDSDITNGRSFTRNKISILVEGDKEIEWSVTTHRTSESESKRQTMKNFAAVDEAAAAILEKSEDDPGYNLPLAVYYPVNRAVLDIPLRVSVPREFAPVEAYDQALGPGRNDFHRFFEWFRQREDLENEERLKSPSSFGFEDRLLSAVRRAILELVPGFRDPRIKRSPLRMVVSKDGNELVVSQLSDGEKCLLALVGDLARRLSIANPSLGDPLDGAAVVLIDEIELHLHPGWQRMVIPALQRAFPNCQFIVSTHSPQVLADIQPEDIYILERVSNGVSVSHPESSYGRDSSRILEDVMGVPARPLQIKDELLRLFRLIDVGDLEKAQKVRSEIEDQIGLGEPEFARADVHMRRRLIKR